MKKKSAALAIALCLLATTSTAFAERGRHYRNHGSYNHGHYGGSHHHRSHHYRYPRGGHYNDGLGIAVGVVGGLLLGSALMYSTTPPRTVVYREPYTTYQPEIIVRQPRICMEERIISGQWQTSRYDGRRVWVSFLNPVHQRIQVPCD